MQTWLWTFVVALVSHLCFSHLGYNNGDDGFCLALAQRILWGEFPHVDFISIRPVGSGLLWAPVLALAKDYAFLATRFLCWWQFSWMSWAWMKMALATRPDVLSLPRQRLLHLFCFFVGTSVFSYFAWNTVDGLFFATLGFICLRQPGRMQVLGYFLVGMSMLFKQNFLALLPLAALLHSLPKKMALALVGLLPAFLYWLAVEIKGGSGELALQFKSYTDVWGPGFWAYIGNKSTYRGLLVALGLFLLGRWTKKSAVLVPLGLTGFWVYLLQIWAEGKWTYKAPFVFFAWGLGLLLLQFREHKTIPVALCLALGAAWVTSISGGYQTPIVGTLALLPFIVTHYLPYLQKMHPRILTLLFLATLLVWVHGRRNYIYGEYPASELNTSLDGLLPGGKGLYSTAANAQALSAIKQIRAKFPSEVFALLPDYPGYWLNSSIRNPLPIDWANTYELTNPQVEKRLFNFILSLKGKGSPLILLQNFAGHTFSPLGAGQILSRTDRRGFIVFIESNFQIVESNTFFTVYRP